MKIRAHTHTYMHTHTTTTTPHTGAAQTHNTHIQTRTHACTETERERERERTALNSLSGYNIMCFFSPKHTHQAHNYWSPSRLLRVQTEPVCQRVLVGLFSELTFPLASWIKFFFKNRGKVWGSKVLKKDQFLSWRLWRLKCVRNNDDGSSRDLRGEWLLSVLHAASGIAVVGA